MDTQNKNIQYLTHKEFIKRFKSGELNIYYDRRYINLVKLLFTPYFDNLEKISYLFWECISFILTIPLSIIVIFILHKPWIYALGSIICGMVIHGANERTLRELIIEKILENEIFWFSLLSHEKIEIIDKSKNKIKPIPSILAFQNEEAGKESTNKQNYVLEPTHSNFKNLLKFLLVAFVIFIFYYLLVNYTSKQKDLAILEYEMNQIISEAGDIEQKLVPCFKLQFYDMHEEIILECYSNIKRYEEIFNKLRSTQDKIVSYIKEYQFRITNEKESRLIENVIKLLHSQYFEDTMEAISIRNRSLINFFEYLKEKDLNTLTNEDRGTIKALAEDVLKANTNLISKFKLLKNFINKNFEEEFREKFINELEKYIPLND